MDPSSLTSVTTNLPWWLQPQHRPFVRRSAIFAVGLCSVGSAGSFGLPFESAFLRIQANYRPTGKASEGSEEIQPTLGLFGTLKRVWKEEGRKAGLWRGVRLYMTWFASIYAVGAAFTLAIPLDYLYMFLEQEPIVPKGFAFAQISLLQILATTLVTLPLQVLWRRRLLTPYRPLRTRRRSYYSMSPRANLQRLLSLYRIPGLLLAVFFLAALPFVQNAIEEVLLPEKGAALYPFSYLRLSWEVIGRGVLASVIRLGLDLGIGRSLDNLIIRMSTQEDFLEEEDHDDEEEKTEIQKLDASRSSSSSTSLVRFRTGLPPYNGLLDAAKTIVRGEGWPTLFRTWEWTLLSISMRLLL